MSLKVTRVSKLIAIPGKIIGWINLKLTHAFGWSFEGSVPDVPKWIGIGAYHTSNWDFIVMMAAGVYFKLRVNWLGKHSLFKPPFGRLMRLLGGIPIKRDKSYNAVQQVIDELNRHDKVILVIAPEGTRKFVDHWKTGFYYIAVGAKMPLLLCYVNYKRKVVGLGELFYPTGDIEADFKHIREFYATYASGRHPEKEGIIRTEAEKLQEQNEQP